MTGADVKAIREALGPIVGRHVSCRDLGLALGLAPANAGHTVRRYEEDGPSGPTAVALMFMRECTRLACNNTGLQTREDIERIVRALFKTRAPAGASAPH